MFYNYFNNIFGEVMSKKTKMEEDLENTNFDIDDILMCNIAFLFDFQCKDNKIITTYQNIIICQEDRKDSMCYCLI